MSDSPVFHLVLAATKSSRGIGNKGDLPWRLPKELAHFKQLTTTTHLDGAVNAIIMGRRTWDSIPAKFRPLPGRLNIVLSRSKPQLGSDVHVCSSFVNALQFIHNYIAKEIENVYVIGGAQVYEEALQHPGCQSIYYTEIISPEFPVDTFFPPIDENIFEESKAPESEQIIRENDVEYRYLHFIRKPEHEELQYLRLVRDVILHGNARSDRTGVGTKSKFGVQLRFSLRNDTFPLLTTKRVWFDGIAKELLWFVRGSTDSKLLSQEGVKIWDANGTKEFLTKCGLGHREEGDLGPVYGFQWRHWGAEYQDAQTDYTGKGIDQLKDCIELIKKDPYSRRIILTAWNPSHLRQMALPPCHMFCQFYVSNGELSCQLYQRSADLGLGVPFNIASYALLTRMVAQVCNLKAGDFVHTIGDAHVYSNHFEGLREQLKRTPNAFPKLKINPDVHDIDNFKYADFEVVNYKHGGTIKLPFAV